MNKKFSIEIRLYTSMVETRGIEVQEGMAVDQREVNNQGP